MIPRFPVTDTNTTEGALYAAVVSPIWDPFGDAQALGETKTNMMSFVLGEVARQESVGDGSARTEAPFRTPRSRGGPCVRRDAAPGERGT